MERPWQLRKGAVPWNSLLANNLTNQAKVTLAVVMLTGAPCLGDQGKCHKIPSPGKKMRMSSQKAKGAREKENCVFPQNVKGSSESCVIRKVQMKYESDIIFHVHWHKIIDLKYQ